MFLHKYKSGLRIVYILQSINIPLTFAGDGLHDEGGMVLLMSRKQSGDGSDKTEVEIRGCKDECLVVR